jgi:capsular polysaccharide biosynthesis protein
VLDNRRILAVKGQLFGQQMLDDDGIKAIRLAARSLLDEDNPLQYPTRIYIKRKNALFRRLTNKDKIESILDEFDFEFIAAEHLTYPERVGIFGNAKIIVAESGAGLANSHFCASGAVVLELRHPGMLLSEEESAVSDLQIKWIRVVGETANFFQRILLGTDSYKIDYKQFRMELSNAISIIKGDEV